MWARAWGRNRCTWAGILELLGTLGGAQMRHLNLLAVAVFTTSQEFQPKPGVVCGFTPVKRHRGEPGHTRDTPV
jgi:hypothetical protein